MPAMPSLVFFPRTCQRCRLAMQAMHCIPSSSYPYLQFRPKWFSSQGPFSFTQESFSCTQFISKPASMREGKVFAGTKLLQAAQLSGKATNINKEIKIPSRVDINAEAEAQRALLDYLHDTRNLNFTHAEYIAMNAPSFVKKLLAKARAGKDIRKAVDKYLQYNPINEFEPFFESIGIKPSEIGALLTTNQICLSENTVLMHNVSTLWNFGIPRNKLGHIYTEEEDIFNHRPGVLQGMLQAYENLGLTKACLARIFVSCPSLLNGNIDKEFDALLSNLYGLGMVKDQICSCFESNPSSWRGISEKLRLLDSFGCPREEVGRYVRTNLQALVECPKKNLKSKVSFLLKSGTAKKNTVPQDPGLLWDKNIDRDKQWKGSTSNTNTYTNKNTFIETKIPDRLHINAEAETQRALLDYLYNTRNLDFTYAEYIVMNAPSFVKNLLAKARAGKDIRKSVDKYLQYNPINEFEPFFESIGIKPSEIGALLTTDQIYLSENTVLMHNVSTLWNHGIPRNRLGQIYKEEKDIFSQPPGVLQGMLQAYENLGLTKACLAKTFVSCPFLLNGNIDKEFDALINNLYGLGLGKDQICSFLESNPSSWRGISEKLSLLDSFGCPREEVGRYVRTNLQALVECSKKNLKSKVSFLSKSEMANKNIGKTILQDPELLIGDMHMDRHKYRIGSTSIANINTETTIPERVHINAEAETQRALLDYLYNTRNLDFTYAEYIVMNAPSFVKKLLAKARAGKDIRKSVDKYLQYNPINEFEPFFESIGIKPSEIGALLATDQIYLSENTVLMHNVSTLCNHGIPRNRLGQIYKEEKDIFSQPPGVLQGMLQAYENLGLTKACLAKTFVSCPFLLNGNIDKEFDALINNLYGLGLGKDQICSFLESNPSSWRGISEKLRLLDSFGCPKEEVGRYVRTNLQALVECSKKNLKSKVSFLSKSEMSNKNIGKTIFQDPKLLIGDVHMDRHKYRIGSTSNANINTETTILERVHINAKAETQRALLDYLYNTRNLNFTYAEYIVMNAPSFVKKLLAKTRAGKDIRKSVGKYLQYNPINEFEPFFESIGIKPSEIGALLATDQIYLSENTVLMHNVSTLWNYGIPRNRLGQIYKEERDIFNHPPGVLQGILQAYEKLRLTKACLAKIFVSFPSLLNGNIDKEFDALINNLYGLGMGKDQICSFFESNPSSWRRISEKLRLLDSFGCPREEVGRYARTNLQALVECSKKNLKSKVSFLLKSRMAKKNTVPQDPGLRRDEHIDRDKHRIGSKSNTNTYANTNTEIKTPDRVHINVEAETQRALLNYLHDTRNLNFTHAEYIVMNAPNFIKKLLAKARAGKDIRKAVDNYLQYNPINEFEPFLESIGIKPSEISGLLAADQIYLSENMVLMHNVSTLWNYGIPRNRLGKIYKEKKDVFNLSPGVLQGMLQAYEKLGLTKACLANIFVSCPSLLNSNIDKEFDALLNNLYQLGMEKHQICTTFESDPSSWRGISENLMLLDSFGCPREEVSRYVRINFQALAECSEKNLKSKVGFLSKLGMTKKNIGKSVLQYPELFIWDIHNSMAEDIKVLRGKQLKQTEIQGNL